MIQVTQLDAALTLQALLDDVIHERVKDKRKFKQLWDTSAIELEGKIPMFSSMQMRTTEKNKL